MRRGGDRDDRKLPAPTPILFRALMAAGTPVFSTFLHQSRLELLTPLIPSSARGIDGQPWRFTEVMLNEQSLPVAWRSHEGIPRCVQVAGCCLSLLHRRCV